MNERKVDSAYPSGGYYKDMNAFSKNPGQPGKYFALTPIGRDCKEAGEYLVGYTRGYYGNLGNLPQRLRAHANEHGFTFTGPVYEMYLHDEITVEDPDEYLIQVSVPVKAKSKSNNSR
jgi:effector-binding domain-containing protein